MSDTPEDLAKEKWLVTVAEPEFAYIYEGLGKDTVDLLYSLKIPNSLLLRWSEVIKSIPGARVSYNDLLNLSICGGAFLIKSDKTTTCTCKVSGESNRIKRIEHRLATQARIITSNLRKPKHGKGQRRKIYLDKLYQVAIKSNEVVPIRSLLGTKVCELVENVEYLLQWRQRYTDLVGAIKVLHADICKDMQSKHDSDTSEPTDLLQDIQYCNDELRNFVLGCSSSPHSKHEFIELSKRQQQRRLKQLKNKFEIVSWFANALDLDITMLKVKPTNSDQERVLIDSQTSTSKNNSEASDAQNKEATELLESILYILDKYSVGDAFYHELATLNDGLPRSYLIKQCRKQMNLIYTVQKTPSPIPGAQLEFEIVFRDELSKFLSNPDNAGKQTVRIKICGDGTKVSRIANYVCLSFS